MIRYVQILGIGAALLIPVAGAAQDRDRQDRHDSNSQQQSRHYEDRAHNDSHDWNQNEDQAYRRYLQEHHKKYRSFDRAKQNDQSNYWNWRHSHPDGESH